MRHKQIPKLLATVWLLLCTVAAVRAQSGDPFKDYQQDAKGLSTLYRGKLQKVYPFRYNGTFYLDSRAFREGELLYNGKYYSGILMNIDAYMQELVVRPQATSAGVVLHRDEVAWFRFDDRLFVNLRYLGYKKADEGFYEVLRDGREPIIRMGIKHFGTSTGALSSSEEAGLDGNYSPDVINLFSRRDRYYVLLTDGTLDKISAGGCKRRMKKPYDPSGSPFTDEAFVKKLDGEANEGNVPKTNFDPISSNFLPVGFFEDTKQKDSIAAANAAMRVTYRNKIYEIGKDGKAPKGGKATISGVVLEAETGLPLPGTVIFDDNTRSYVRTDKDGRYSITLPLGDNVLNFNCESKEDLPLKIHLYANGTLDVVMTEVITYLKGSIISANSMQQHRITAIGVEKVNIKTLVKIPSAFGEGDILKAVLTLPGVKTVGEASGGINVRGGSADQNLILFGDNTIYNPTHLFGIFSSFNPDIIELHPGPVWRPHLVWFERYAERRRRAEGQRFDRYRSADQPPASRRPARQGKDEFHPRSAYELFGLPVEAASEKQRLFRRRCRLHGRKHRPDAPFRRSQQPAGYGLFRHRPLLVQRRYDLPLHEFQRSCEL